MPDSLFTNVTVTIAQNGTISGAAAMGDAVGLERIEMPAAWSNDTVVDAPAPFVTFLGGQDSVTFRPVYYEDQLSSVPVDANRSIVCYAPVSGLKFLKVVASYAQAASRAIILVFRNQPPPVDVNVTVEAPPP